MNIQKMIIIISLSLMTNSIYANDIIKEDNNHSHHEHSKMHSNMNTSEEINNGNIIYVCPMHPEVIEDHIGNCPICGMNLEKVVLEEE